ncbi:MAG: hypothetical protein JM58_09485 [Peptococcaceae bacterium BICA1-8]|nr:MAG: hypothetical protein JM58_09485 [Peptococcaceae bacterium BICA1-8]
MATAEKISYAYDLTGSDYCVEREFDIATGTVIEQGEVVKLSSGKVVAIGDADQDDPYLGIAAEAHTGTADTLNPRADGLRIKVKCSPTAVFKCKPGIVSTADSGNTTTWVDAEVTAVADDTYNGGYLKLTEKATASTLTSPLGTVYAVTDFATTSGTFTGAFAGGVVAGDKALIFPPVGGYGWDLNSDGTNLDLKAHGGESIVIIDVDTQLEYVYFMLRLHQFGNYMVAL